MRHALVIAALAGVVAFLTSGRPAEAQARQIYPFCYVSYSPFGPQGSYQCFFTSYAQCMATQSGLGGQCEQNPEWLARPQPVTKARRAQGH